MQLRNSTKDAKCAGAKNHDSNGSWKDSGFQDMCPEKQHPGQGQQSEQSRRQEVAENEGGEPGHIQRELSSRKKFEVRLLTV